MIKRFRLIILAALILRIFLSFLTWHPDVNNHVDWGIRFWQYGAKDYYSANVWSYTWPNQPPGTIYIYAGITKLYDFVFSIFWWINLKIPLFPSDVIFYLESNLYPALLKLPSMLADLGIAYLIYKSVADKKIARFGVVLWLVNPIVWYNSSLWGQTDSLIAFFVFLAFYLLKKNKPELSLLSYALSVYIKVSLLIFIPIYVYLFIKEKYKPTIYVKSVILVLLVVVGLTVPFAKGNPLVWLYDLYQNKIFAQQLQVITANAFNIWTTIASIHEKPQTLYLGPLTYRMWGTLSFILSYLVLIFFFIKSKAKDVYFTLSLIAFSSFMLMTNMHERYLYPFFPFFTAVTVSNKKLLKVYIIVSIISLLNLYNFWWYPKISFIVGFLSFSDRLMPRILGFVMFLIYLYLFKLFLRQTRTSKI
ncbi:MAG: hypothetical protein UT39_C0007G0027 [Candidatus Woesebacteria bacterium GW2011_GWA1_39_21]|uniref:Uncharacterized protein n=1 Tax=Candidatus Woesebacteria bacterium GW2011_GWA1_39_21 TaxID=1618550 RepID=A0A0G0RCM9_9BACT|nr:MAG: hypothetical protein UT39_C0007G0027 [Candidatus Woesebacteria bacterium GW2011_GWA1_39_21]